MPDQETSKVQYWRCQNDECGFFIKRRKKYPFNQKGKRWEDKARWLIAKGIVEKPSWIALKCPQCDYHVEPGLEIEHKLDNEPVSIIKSFKELKRAD